MGNHPIAAGTGVATGEAPPKPVRSAAGETQPSPTPFAPLLEVRTLRAQCGVIPVPGIDDRVVAVDVEHPARDVAEQLFESAWLPGLSDSAGEPVVAGCCLSGYKLVPKCP